MTDADLEYAGRERKRPPGASDLVQRIYTLLHEHQRGMTRDELHAVLRDAWLETDAYRAYAQYLSGHRKVYDKRRPGHRLQYGSEQFKERAQRWWIRQALAGMQRRGTARYDDGRWFTGHRAPRVSTEEQRRTYKTLDVAKARAASQADTEAHVRREQMKARFLADLNDPKLATATRKNVERLRETIRLGYEYLSGR